MIEVASLTKTFSLSRKQKRELGGGRNNSSVDALRDISFTCKPGRVFALLGPNGAGKTTALRIIATMLQPTSGTVRVCDLDTGRDPHLVRSCLGVLTGQTGLYDRLTPTEMVRYFADLNGMDRDHFEQRRRHLFERLDMEDFADRRIGRLSTGMRQKVSIARTVIHAPEVIVFDEPTAGLDAVTSRNIVQLVRDSREAGKTIIFSTHRMGEVDQLSDDVAIVHKGALLYNGTYSDFKTGMQAPTLEDEFVRLIEEVDR
jgi:sodium transport system ATP-binding protein